MGKRKDSEELKLEAPRLTSQGGASVAQVARDLGISSNMLSGWRRELEDHGGKAFPGKGVARDPELAQVKREIGR